MSYVTISTKYLNVNKQYVGNFGKKNIGEWANLIQLEGNILVNDLCV